MKFNQLYFVIYIEKEKEELKIFYLTQSKNDNFEFLADHKEAEVFTLINAELKVQFLNKLWNEKKIFYAYNLNNLK